MTIFFGMFAREKKSRDEKKQQWYLLFLVGAMAYPVISHRCAKICSVFLVTIAVHKEKIKTAFSNLTLRFS